MARDASEWHHHHPSIATFTRGRDNNLSLKGSTGRLWSCPFAFILRQHTITVSAATDDGAT
jgi:hypothetical protein